MKIDEIETAVTDSWMRIRLPRGEWFLYPGWPLGPPGGFGEVFQGRDPSGRTVAVKRLKVTAGEAAYRELKIADELAGKAFDHVMEVLDSGEDAEAGGYYVIMPRADRSLADELKTRGVLPSAEAIDILMQIAEGMKEFSGIVHRDLKPGNVLLHNGRWKVADFGIARFVEDATSINTVRGFLSPPYAAPEQWVGERATSATDVYALGCIGHVLLRGEPPFAGPDFQRQHVLETPPVLSTADPRVRAILAAALRKPATGRPTLERIIAVLQDVSANPAPRTPAMAALQAANATEAERASAAASEAERVRRKAAERSALIRAGEAVVREIISRVGEVARHNAPESLINVSGTGPLSIAIGSAELRIELQGAVPPNAGFPQAKWDVLAIGRIDVKQAKPAVWSYGATLWYMRLQPEAGYRWYEVSYKRNALVRGPLVGPFPIQDLGNDIYRQADLAAGPGMHTIEMEFGPVTIDDEDAEVFVERWLARLAQAYNGRLCPF
jgi:eukaryotic-like serine/threonine-protein kinase